MQLIHRQVEELPVVELTFKNVNNCMDKSTRGMRTLT